MSTMFCNQCEQTAKGGGCTSFGVCGKDPESAALQDLLTEMVKGLSQCAHRARRLGVVDASVNAATADGLFTTVTNVNFDPVRIATMVRHVAQARDRARASYEAACQRAGQLPEELGGAALLQPAADLDDMISQGEAVGIEACRATVARGSTDAQELLLFRRGSRFQTGKIQSADVSALQELLVYGIKGVAAYAKQARSLGFENDAVYAFMHEALCRIAEGEKDVNQLLSLVLRCGEANLKAMELLDAANTGAYGHPEPTHVRSTPVRGKAILVSGHDLKCLERVLEQTEGKGVNVYTHGEMLPAHGYPGLRKYRHLVGNFGGAWQDQRQEFAQFPGAILMTTNCIQKPKESYAPRLFTTDLVAWPGVVHIAGDDFAHLVDAALAAEGFTVEEPGKTVLVGCARQTLLGAVDLIIKAVKTGRIRHFYLIGGCDGAKSGRNYYTELALALPKDCVILTLACGKYRFNKFEFGEIDGIPRLLDVGQCNDAHSAVRIVAALADAFGCEINDLPLSLILSWFEQKAVAILLSLLYLRLSNIRLGPTMPAFLTPALLDVLVRYFGVIPVTTPQQDIAATLN